MEVENTSPQDFLTLLRRRRAPMFGVFAFLSISSVFGTLMLDDQYRSTAIIAIERPEIPENMVRTTVTKYDTDLRIERNTDTVLSDDNVRGWINDYRLYQDIVSKESMAKAVAQFSRDVEIISIQEHEDLAAIDQGETIAFEVSYFGDTSENAFYVAKALAGGFLEENRKSRNQSVEVTLRFFEKEAERLGLKIADAEAKLANFKERNSGSMPESSTVNVQMMERTERELEAVDREIRDLVAARQLLQTELAVVSPNAPVYSASG